MSTTAGPSMEIGSEIDQPPGTSGEFLVQTEDDTTTENQVDFEDSEGADPNAPLREQDRFLPIANVAKIMKNSIPHSGKISKEAKECVQECVSEFVSFITSEAAERCMQEKRKTINGEDLLFAMSSLGFDNYVEPLKLFLQKYREFNRDVLQKGKLPDGLEETADNADDGTSTLHFSTDGSDVAAGGCGETAELDTLDWKHLGSSIEDPSASSTTAQTALGTRQIVYAGDPGATTYPASSVLNG